MYWLVTGSMVTEFESVEAAEDTLREVLEMHRQSGAEITTQVRNDAGAIMYRVTPPGGRAHHVYVTDAFPTGGSRDGEMIDL